jgi:16S rRNA (uracil1498-N3)-methyltransferase
MPTNRFYSPQLQNKVVIDGDEHHHLTRVMKRSVGDSVELVDGKGHLAIAIVEQIGKKETALSIQSISFFQPDTFPVSLGLPMMRPSKLEWVIEKATELGASHFYFYRAEKSEKEEFSKNQMERMSHLMVAAMKQSGRLYLPLIHPILSLQELLKMKMKILFGDTDQAAEWITPIQESVLFISGPESGFSFKETKMLKEKASGVKLNQNILRAETAPIAALSILCRQ